MHARTFPSWFFRIGSIFGGCFRGLLGASSQLDVPGAPTCLTISPVVVPTRTIGRPTGGSPPGPHQSPPRLVLASPTARALACWACRSPYLEHPPPGVWRLPPRLAPETLPPRLQTAALTMGAISKPTPACCHGPSHYLRNGSSGPPPKPHGAGPF